MTTFKQLQDEVLLALHGYGLSQPRTTFLTGGITSGALTATVRDTSDIDMGLAEIDGELVFIESVDRATHTLTFSPDGRGFYARSGRQTQSPLHHRGGFVHPEVANLSELIDNDHPSRHPPGWLQ